ncbi:MAG: hypothetical protein CMJ46_01165 [Planctomyces sp.]|nr:hypothetical protein [Planctomyces sp.]
MNTSPQYSLNGNRIIGLPFALLIIAASMTGFCFACWAYLTARETRDWPTVPGKFIDYGVEYDTSGSSTRYYPLVGYEYTVEEIPLYGHRLSFNKNSFSSEAEAIAVSEQFEVGQTVEVYYVPEDPRESVIVPGGENELLIPMGGMALALIVGVLLFYHFWRMPRYIELNSEPGVSEDS